MRWLLTSMGVLSGLSCAPLPQNAEEFKALVLSGYSSTQAENYSVPRELETLVADFRVKALPILNARESSTVMSGNNMSTSVTFKNAFLEQSGDKWVLSLQREFSPRPIGRTLPPGGVFHLVAEFERGEGGTRVGVYGLKRWGVVFKAIRDWSEGKEVAPFQVP